MFADKVRAAAILSLIDSSTAEIRDLNAAAFVLVACLYLIYVATGVANWAVPGLSAIAPFRYNQGVSASRFSSETEIEQNRVATKPAVLGREIAGGRSSIRCIMHHSADAIWRSALYLTMGFVSAKAGQLSLSLSDSCVCTVAGLVRRARFSAFFFAISFALSSMETTRSGAALPKRLR